MIPERAATITKNYATHYGRTAGNNGGIAEGQLIPYQCHGSNVGPMGTLRKGNGNEGGGVPFVTHSLRGEGFDASEDGTGRGTPLVTHALNAKGAQGRMDGESETFVIEGDSAASTPKLPRLRAGAGGHGTAIAREGMAVRRLTPVECEKLQGLPVGHTKIAWRGKPPEKCPDGPRYRAIGNGMAMPVLRWIGERIQLVEDMR